jgi:hypothetical protein
METDMKPTPIGRFADTPSYEELRREVARLRLTDEEREAISAAACICEDAGRTEIAIAVNTALSRLD